MTRRHLLSSAAGFVLVASAMPASAQSVDQAAATSDETTDIIVYGRGETRQVQTLTAVDIERTIPGTSPLQVLAKLPSVQFQSASPLGTNEWSTRISVRGFAQNQLGFTLDGVPLGDMSYANFNGLHISRAITSENIGRSTLSQGAGALSTASTSNLGGTIQFYSMDPGDELGGVVQGTYGSENAWTTFARLESGDIGGGIKGYISGSYVDAPKWKGRGKQEAWTINSKIVIPLGAGGTFKGFVNYSNWKDDDYADMWPEMQARQGYDWDYLRYDWKTSKAIADNYNNNGVYCASYDGYSQPICGDDAYYDGYGLRKDLLIGGDFDFAFSDNLKLKLTPYYHNNRGIGTWWTFYTPTPGGANLSVRSTEYWISRGGLTGSLALTLGNHTFETGGWYEYNSYEQAREYFALADTDHSTIGQREWPKNPFKYDYDYKFKINTYQYFVQDTWQVTDALKISGGFKGIEVDIDNNFVKGVATSWDTTGGLKSKDMFIPQAGLNYMFSKQFEAFASYAENMRAFTTEPFITSPAQFALLKENNLKPETSRTFEAGVRFHLPRFEGSLAAYHVNFDNRLFSVSPGTAIESLPATLSNVGSVTTNGVELAGTYTLTHALSLYASYAYTDATYDDDVLNGGGELVIDTKDKSVVDLPKHLANVDLNYDDGSFIAGIRMNYQSKRYATYSNDLSFAGRALFDLNLGYRYHGEGAFDGTEIQLNVTNLFDKEYVATIAETGGYRPYFATNPYAYYLVGAPRQVFVTLKKKF